MPASGTMEEAAQNWVKRLTNLRDRGLQHIINSAAAVIDAEAPMYLGVYRDAVFFDTSQLPEALSMRMTEGSVIGSAASHGAEISEAGYSIPVYVYGEPSFDVAHSGFSVTKDNPTRFSLGLDDLGEGSVPYPVRIEAMGSPVRGDGQFAWAHAREAAKRALREALRMATR